MRKKTRPGTRGGISTPEFRIHATVFWRLTASTLHRGCLALKMQEAHRLQPSEARVPMKTQPSGIASFLQLRPSQLSEGVRVASYMAGLVCLWSFTTNSAEDSSPTQDDPKERVLSLSRAPHGG